MQPSSHFNPFVCAAFAWVLLIGLSPGEQPPNPYRQFVKRVDNMGDFPSKWEEISKDAELKSTVLYKVSHHGSHNATVRAKGLDLMTHPDLVAMIPEKEKSYNGILYKPLLRRLRKRCKGRVLISADAEFRPEDLLKKRPSELSAAEWKAFKANLTVDQLYVEYTIR